MLSRMLKSKNFIYKKPSREDYRTLRNVRPCDDFYYMVGKSPDDTIFDSDEKFNKSFESSLRRDNYWHIFKGESIIGVTFIHSICEDDRHARYAVGIYNKENWGKAYGQEITHTVLDYAFNTLDLHKIDLLVLDYNVRAINSYKQSGFVEEGRLRENGFVNNEWHDDVVMSILKREFKGRSI